MHEPGITEKHRDFENYNKIITFKTVEIAIINVLSNDCSCCPKKFKQLFDEDIKENFEKNKKEILDLIQSHDIEKSNIKTSLYLMNIVIDWKRLKSDIKSI